ncbi:MAG: imidazole glycerol phosphate synthase subunit HisH [Bacteroidota bacterium]
MIVVIKYNAGNITSIKNAVERLGYECKISGDENEIINADKIIFPGVGEASSAMKYLKENNLDVLIKSLKQPVLGICLGLQLLCKYSEEGNTDSLGIFDTIIKKFPPKDLVPHMGWNNLQNLKGNLFNAINNNDNFYFVHSYYAEISNETTAICDYILPFSAALQKNNFYATQFHPEKSAGVGEIILQNFLRL